MLDHLAGNIMNAYDRMEAYEVCGEELREAYVGLKRMRRTGKARSIALQSTSTHPSLTALLHPIAC
jgi:hypothetical protein